jgi:hypothetical protein
MLTPLNELFPSLGRVQWRKLLAWACAIVLAVVVAELAGLGVRAAAVRAVETLGPGGMAGLICGILLAAIVALNLR